MQTSFSPSINIERDFDKKLNYIRTPNSSRIFQQITDDYKIGTRAFTIIGSYGTGKSAFLWALEQQLTDNQNYFKDLNGQFQNVASFKFLNIVGEYDSITNTFARKLNLHQDSYSNQLIIDKLNGFIDLNSCLVIVLDEFGKFLEYAAANNPERELYFVQQLAEFANDPSRNVLLITVLHQSFDAYARKLDKTQRQEWEKVKGRLREIVFNEPVEQLLSVGAERLKNKNFDAPIDFDPTSLVQAIKVAKVFPLRTDLSIDLAKNLYPLDLLSAAILTKALQTYGQNERSLFTFLESDDVSGLNTFDANKDPHYNLCKVYDYLLNNFSSLLTTKYNPHFFQWRTIQYAIDRIETNLERQQLEAIKLVKIIGLLNIFGSAGSRIDDEFLANYGKLSIGLENVVRILKGLEDKKIIRFLNYKNQYNLYEGTDLDIEIEVDRAGEKVAKVTDIVPALRSNFYFPYLSAKSASFKIGTPRFFKFHISESPVFDKPKEYEDGIVNLILSEELTKKDVIEFSKEMKEAILFGFYQNTTRIREILFEIRKIKYVIDNLVDDRVAERELRNMLEFQKQELNHYVLNNLYRDTNEVVWVFQGQEIQIQNRSRFNKVLSEICDRIYYNTPIFKNELINKEKLSSPITKARRNLMQALVEKWDEKDLGFGNNEFPPEKTIYLSLLKETGIHRKNGDSMIFDKPREESFKPLWQVSEEFLKGAKHIYKNVSELVEQLTSIPFKLKRGFIDFWIPIFLFIKREDFALYGEDGLVPVINDEVLELVTKSPQKFRIKTFELEGVKLDLFNRYRKFLNQNQKQQLTTSTFIETIKPFLSFYKNLPEYSQRTKRLSSSALKLREAIANATDLERTFFEDFPKALGYADLNLSESDGALTDYVTQLQNAIRELRSCFDNLLSRIEDYLLRQTGYDELSFTEYKQELEKRYRTLKEYLLLPYQVVFFKQLCSELDDRNAWLRAIVQALLGKSVEKMRDEEEELIIEKMSNTINELDNLCDISKMEIDPEKEEVLKLELTSLSNGNLSQVIRLPKKKEEQVRKLRDKIKSILSKDKTTNLSALIKLLQDESHNE